MESKGYHYRSFWAWSSVEAVQGAIEGRERLEGKEERKGGTGVGLSALPQTNKAATKRR